MKIQDETVAPRASALAAFAFAECITRTPLTVELSSMEAAGVEEVAEESLAAGILHIPLLRTGQKVLELEVLPRGFMKSLMKAKTISQMKVPLTEAGIPVNNVDVRALRFLGCLRVASEHDVANPCLNEPEIEVALIPTIVKLIDESSLEDAAFRKAEWGTSVVDKIAHIVPRSLTRDKLRRWVNNPGERTVIDEYTIYEALNEADEDQLDRLGVAGLAALTAGLDIRQQRFKWKYSVLQKVKAAQEHVTDVRLLFIQESSLGTSLAASARPVAPTRQTDGGTTQQHPSQRCHPVSSSGLASGKQPRSSNVYSVSNLRNVAGTAMKASATERHIVSRQEPAHPATNSGLAQAERISMKQRVSADQQTPHHHHHAGKPVPVGAGSSAVEQRRNETLETVYEDLVMFLGPHRPEDMSERELKDLIIKQIQGWDWEETTSPEAQKFTTCALRAAKACQVGSVCNVGGAGRQALFVAVENATRRDYTPEFRDKTCKAMLVAAVFSKRQDFTGPERDVPMPERGSARQGESQRGGAFAAPPRPVERPPRMESTRRPAFRDAEGGMEAWEWGLDVIKDLKVSNPTKFLAKVIRGDGDVVRKLVTYFYDLNPEALAKLKADPQKASWIFGSHSSAFFDEDLPPCGSQIERPALLTTFADMLM